LLLFLRLVNVSTWLNPLNPPFFALSKFCKFALNPFSFFGIDFGKGLCTLKPIGKNGERMLREQAVALLKELVANNLIQTSWVSIEERTPNSYEL
jgi:hypothetical protein